MLVTRTNNLLQQKKLGEIKLLGSSLLTKEQHTDASYLQAMLIRQGDLNILQKFATSFAMQERCLCDTATYTFSRLLAPVDRRLISCEVEQILLEVSATCVNFSRKLLCFSGVALSARLSTSDTFSPMLTSCEALHSLLR